MGYGCFKNYQNSKMVLENLDEEMKKQDFEKKRTLS